ncbi:MAG: hypothetical protein AB7K24_04150 [Gemmataceae bacterium]
MECESKIVEGAYKVDSQGDVDLISRGRGAMIQAQGKNGQVNLSAMGSVNLTSGNAVMSVECVNPLQSEIKLLGGPLGTITQTAGPPIVGPKIEIGPESITLSVGPPEGGAKLVLSATGIELKHGLTSFKLSGLTGIEESLGATSRKLTPLGHEMEAAESKHKVTVMGIESTTPLRKEETATVAQVKATMLTIAADAMQQTKAGIEMHG